MAGVPVVFRDQRERVLTNYNFIDLIQGQGIVTYYLFQGETDAGDTYGASSDSAKRSKEIQFNFTTGAGDGSIETDFDVGQFNQGMTIEGTAYCQGSYGCVQTSGSGSAGDISIQFLIRKFDGTTETEIANDISGDISGTGEADFLIPITIPKTTFKAGDTLRLTVKLIKTGGSGGVWKLFYGTDPLNRDGDQLTPSSDDRTTITKVQMPFKVDI